MPVIVLFRRDLRLEANPALNAAIESGEVVIPVYLHDDNENQPWRLGGASRWYLQQSLLKLEASLALRGHQLLYLTGKSEQDLISLAQGEQVSTIFLNRVYEPSRIKRDKALKRTCLKQGLTVNIYHDYSLFKPGTILNKSGLPYRVFTPFWRALSSYISDIGLPSLKNGGDLNNVEYANSKIGCTLNELNLLDKHQWHEKLHSHWSAGEVTAKKKWSSLLINLADYPENRNFPALSGTSGLSAALHFGEISIGQMIHDLWPAMQGECGSQLAGAAEALARQLGWREFALNLLYDNPHSDQYSLQGKFDQLGVWENNSDWLSSWQEGRTGISIVDAGMQELWETGIMHNRVRMVAASFLTKNLGVHWLHGAKWFWDTLVDADLANNSMGWQWVAGCGCDAAPFYRIFNPVRQAERFDPKNVYIDRWLIAQKSGTSPVIDLAKSRDQALIRYQMMKARSI
ncbi:MAG: deoxyribodipyrimidine photo-lyase [Saprospiraceae bacterium]|jgi:deoxyribodipyrimidine photo-lyase